MILIKQVEVYAPEYLGEQDVLIADGKIEWIRKTIDLSFEPIKVIDGKWKKLVPGMIDNHVHITGGGGEGSFKTRVPELPLSSLLKGGITTVIGLMGTDGITRSVESLLARVKTLREEGITAYMHTGSYGYPSKVRNIRTKDTIIRLIFQGLQALELAFFLFYKQTKQTE